MKRVVKYIVLLIILIIPISNIKALSLSKNEITLNKSSNEEIELYANSTESLTKVDFNLIYSSNDIIGQFIVNKEYKDITSSGTKHSITFNKPETGKILLGKISIKSNNQEGNGTININNAIGLTSNNKEIGLNSQLINIKVGTTEEKEMLLKSIDSKIVKIDLKDNIYEYDVDLNDNISVLDLKPIPYNNDCIINISTQKIKEITNNKIVIKAFLDNKEEEYIINLNINKTKEKIEIDNEKFIPNNSYKKKWIVISIGIVVLLLIDLIIIKIKKH